MTRTPGAIWIARSLWIAAVPVTPVAADAQQLTYTGSIQIANGDYIFTDRTTSLYLANGLVIAAGRLRASVNIPVIVQSSGWVQYVGGGLLPSGGMHSDGERSGAGGMRGGMMSPQPDAANGTMGFGDPIARVDLDVLRDWFGTPMLRVAASAKAPLASVESGFGTGAWDFGAGLSLARSLRGNYLLADVMYWSLGTLGELDLRDILSWSVAVGRPISGGRYSLVASMLGTTPIVAGVAAPVQAGIGAVFGASRGRSLSVSALVGLTRSAPDLAIGIGWQVLLR